jgi:hypothetical protein
MLASAPEILQLAAQTLRAAPGIVACTVHDQPGEIRLDLQNGQSYYLKLSTLPSAENAELIELAHTIALEDCESILGSESILVHEDGVDWWDLVDPSSLPPDVDPAQRYLELRHLLVRHPEHANWIRVLDPDDTES